MLKRRALAFEALIVEHQEIKIPTELSPWVQSAIQMGLAEKAKENRETGHKNNENRWKTPLLAAAAVLILFTASVNLSPNFANQLSKIPVLGELVKILTFTDGLATGGQITDGTDVSSIDHAVAGGIEQFTLNFEQGSEAQIKAGAYEVKYQENPYTMSFKISGARMLSALEDFEKIKLSPLVKDIYPMVTLDDSMIRFMIVFNGPVVYEVKEMENPSSLVLELAGIKAEPIGKRFVLQSERMPRGESLAITEEMLMAEFPELRILKDSTDENLFYIEAGQYESKEKAAQMLKQAEPLGVKLLVAEN